MTCKELVELVTEYLEGALPDGERARVDEHLMKCEGCGVYVEQMRRTIRMTGALREDDVPEEAREKLLSAFRDWRSQGA